MLEERQLLVHDLLNGSAWMKNHQLGSVLLDRREDPPEAWSVVSEGDPQLDEDVPWNGTMRKRLAIDIHDDHRNLVDQKISLCLPGHATESIWARYRNRCGGRVDYISTTNMINL